MLLAGSTGKSTTTKTEPKKVESKKPPESQTPSPAAAEAPRPGTVSPAPAGDSSHISSEAKTGASTERKGFGGFLGRLQGAFSLGPSEEGSVPSRDTKSATGTSQAKPESEPLSPEEERRQRIEETGQVLYNYRDFTNGGDDITSRDDYQKIAEGEKNEDFTNYLKEAHPDWSEDKIAGEVSTLQENSNRILNDKDVFDFYDTAKEGGDTDGKISDDDLVAGRLKNDISKDYPPNLSIEQINELHEQNPALGNQAITNKYYHQSQELNELLGGGEGKDFLATWPAFGSLASNSAGGVIRSDGVPLNDSVSNEVAAGNRKVFQDIAPHYDSYIEAAKSPDFNFDEWMKKENFEGKENLQESFEFLERARTSKDNDAKQENLLASNVLAGLHEQRNLDPQIDNSTAPVTGTGVERGLIEAFDDQNPTFFLPNGSGSGKLDELDTSKQIKAPPAGGLEEISDPKVREALAKGLGLDEVPGSIKGQDLIDNTGTEDWSQLNERMRTIAGLMVAGQNDPRMGEYVLDYDAPHGFSTTDHVVGLAEGVLRNNPITGPVMGLFG